MSKALQLANAVNGDSVGINADKLGGMPPSNYNRVVNYITTAYNGTTETENFYFVDTTVAVAQVDTIHDITVADNTTYTTTIDSTDYTYTSDSSANISEIINGVADSVNADSNCNVSADADSNNNTVVLTAKTAGKAFDASVDSNMNISITTPNKTKAVTMTLPASPIEYSRVHFADAKGTFGDDPLTLDRNGNTIMGLDEDLVVDKSNFSLELIFKNNDWRII